METRNTIRQGKSRGKSGRTEIGIERLGVDMEYDERTSRHLDFWIPEMVEKQIGDVEGEVRLSLRRPKISAARY